MILLKEKKRTEDSIKLVTKMFAQLGSTFGSLFIVWTMFQRYFPLHLQAYIDQYLRRLVKAFDPYIHIKFYQYSSDRFRRSEAYIAIENYLSSKSTDQAKRLKGDSVKQGKSLVLSMDNEEEVLDEFQGVKLFWSKLETHNRSTTVSYYPTSGKMYYKLSFHNRYRESVTKSYLNYVLEEGKAIGARNRQKKLYTNNPNDDRSYHNTRWSHVVFEHPATFDTLAMDPKKKEEIIDDLVTFRESKEYYARIGKAWKRGYLLYGPPGTGKSTMIAAIANFLNYDIYDLELTAVKDNTDLRKLLIETSSKSMIVIEDIDCSLALTGQRKKAKLKKEENKAEIVCPIKKKADEEKEGKSSSSSKDDSKTSKVTLSGLLNFIDGIWSASGGERLIIFTTNYVEKLDEALIRRGRMDKHIELSYCDFEGFKVLAKNYLSIDSHPLFEKICSLLEETKITPADVAENLMPKTTKGDAAESCLENLIQALLKAAKEEAMKKKKAEEEEKALKEKEKSNEKIEEEEKQQPGERFTRSEAYSAIENYLSTKSSTQAKRLKADIVKNSNQSLVLSMDDHEEVSDEFEGIKLWWSLGKNISKSQVFSFYPATDEKRYYKLTFHKGYREKVLDSYLASVLKEGKAIKVRNRMRKLYTNNGSMWSHVMFEHPATFQTLAMEPEKKQEIIDDLITFSKAEDFYARIGRAWKRGYLLYGPPGTGKSTMIAAMANLLGYDLYDLELTAVKDNTELRKLLIETSSKSIIVIEDIDCSLDLTGQRTNKKKEKVEDGDENKDPKQKLVKEEREPKNSQVTLSGLLNFIDGLWSACGGERLIVFTTNHIEKLDPALIRKGRMDKHIELSYCSFVAFKALAKNYLHIESHELFERIGELFGEIKMTPADVAEHLMPKTVPGDVEVSLRNLIQGLELAKEEAKLKAEKEEKEEEEEEVKSETKMQQNSVMENGDVK